MPATNQILIAGYAKSGTTMLYCRIRDALEEDAAGFFEPPAPEPVLAGVDRTRSGVTKIILPEALDSGVFAAINPHFDKKLLIIRDPRDILISAMLYAGGFEQLWQAPEHRVSSALRLLAEKERDPARVSVFELFEALMGAPPAELLERISAAQAVMVNFSKANPDFHRVHYETLTAGSPRDLQDYLGLPLAGDTDVGAGLGRVARTKESGSWRVWLTPEDRALLQPVMTDYLAHFGYDPEDWRLATGGAIPADHGSRYVLKILNERRRREGLAEISG